MYSVVLMLALSGGAETPDHGRRDNGCRGGGLFRNGCIGARDHGCHGGRLGLFRRDGCHGGRVFNGCHGHHDRGCHGGRLGLFRRNGCHGGHAHHGCHGVVHHGCHGGHAHHGCHGGVIIEKKGEKIKEMPKKKTETSATILVNLPADARLTIDGNSTSQTSATRLFVTPALESDAEFSYTLVAEIIRDGQTMTQTRQITVRAGEQTNVAFDFATSTISTR